MLHRVDPELRQAAAATPPATPGTPWEERRRMQARFTALTPAAPEVLARLEITDLVAPRTGGESGIHVRLYRPDGAARPSPTLVWIHGGAFCAGSVDGDHALVSRLADASGCTFASVEYRLAPEHPFPAGLDDCVTATRWVAEHAAELGVDAGRLGVGGVSAGGALAAGVALLARERGGPALRFQALVIPVLDDRLETPSAVEMVGVPVFDRASCIEMWDCYLGVHRGAAPAHAAPARADDLGGLPPAYIQAAELDPLRDEAVLHAARLLASGVPCELHTFVGTFHGSMRFPSAISRRQEAELADAIRRGLSGDR